jgi:hypothetical protein
MDTHERGMVTRQTATPLEHTNLGTTSRLARELAKNVREGQIDLNPPYQRGQVWTEDQRVALIRSWLLGLPTGVVILSDRAQSSWSEGTGDIFRTEGAAIWALIDGKQRVSTAMAWYASEFAVPASWFPADLVETTEQTEDGLYVRHSGLSQPGQWKFERQAAFAVAEFRTASTIADEAEIYLLVNGGGTPQSAADMQRAREHAGRADGEGA